LKINADIYSKIKNNMPNFGEQPTSTNRDRISGNEENSENTKKQLADALAAEDYAKVAELGGQMKSLKGQKEEFINKDEEEAYAEDSERKEYDEALAENAKYEQTKAKEKADRESVEISDNLKKQIAEAMAAEDYAKVAELGGQIKELIAGSKKETAEDLQGVSTQAKEDLKELAQKDKEDSEKKAEEILKKMNGDGVENTNTEKPVEAKELSEKEKAFSDLINQEKKYRDTVYLDRNYISLKEVNNVEISSEQKEEIIEMVKSGKFFNQRYSGDKIQILYEKGIISVEDIINGMVKSNREDILKLSPSLLKDMTNKNENITKYAADICGSIGRDLGSVSEIRNSGKGDAFIVFFQTAMLIKYVTLAGERNRYNAVDNAMSEYKRLAPETLKYFKQDDNSMDLLYAIKRVSSEEFLLKSVLDSGMLKKHRIKEIFLDRLSSTTGEDSRFRLSDKDLAKMVAQGILTKEEAFSAVG
jgi:hypothetical protein